jgi:hypothetical protein
MHEGPRRFFGDTEDAAPEEPFDYFEHARKLREEREALEAEKKAERQAKEAGKKAEKEARLAKKIANKATEKLEEKTDKLSQKTASTKEQLQNTKAEVAEISSELKEASKDELPVPLELNMINGSQHEADLSDGAEAFMRLNHTIDKVEETVSLADEVQEQADVLAKARAALENVGSEYVVAGFGGQEETDYFGEPIPHEGILDRLKHTWETSASDPVEPTNDSTLNGAESGSNSDQDTSSGDTYSTPSHADMLMQRPNEGQKETTQIDRFGSGVRNGAAYLGGFFAGRAITAKNRLENSNAVLSSETDDLRRELQTLQARPSSTAESVASIVEAPTSITQFKPVEVRGTNEPAIPRWISQIESDVAKGKVPELKKWQLDVLRAQHPEILKKYEKLDQRTKEQIRQQSKESIRGASVVLGDPAPHQNPNELPAPAYTLPSYMSEQSPSPAPVLEYASTSSSSNGSVFSNEYLTIVVAGGLLFGAVLIAAFGF